MTRAIRAEWVVTMDSLRTGPADTAHALVPDGGVNPEGRVIPDDTVIPDGMVVFERGVITDVGPASEVKERHDDLAVTDLGGHVLLPGFVNAHTHLAMTMFRGVADDVSLEQFLATVVSLEARLLGPDTVREASLAAMVESHLSGVTTALDMYFFADAVMDAARQAGFRAVTGPVVLDEPGPDTPGTTVDERFRSAGSWLADRPVGYDWRPVVGPHSTYLVSESSLVEAASLAGAADALLHLHAAESSDEVAMVRGRTGRHPVALLDDLGILGPRTVLAHRVHLGRGEIGALGRTGASVVHCPSSNLKLASGIAPVSELLEGGVNVALGTDGAASSNDLDVLGAVRLAALLHKCAAPGGPDATALSARDALRMATSNGAAALGLSGRLGVLAPGAMADMVAMDLCGVHTQPVHDVFSAIVYASGRSDVTDVWSRGVRVVEQRVHTLVDQTAAAASLRSLGGAVRAAMSR